MITDMSNHRTWCKNRSCDGHCRTVITSLPIHDSSDSAYGRVTAAILWNPVTQNEVIELQYQGVYYNRTVMHLNRNDALALAYLIHATDYTRDGNTTLAQHFIEISEDLVSRETGKD